MRVLRLMILIVGMLGGALGLSVTAQAAPMPVTSGLVDQASEAPLVNQARWGYYRRHYWRPRYYYRRRFYRPRYYYRPRFYHRRRWRW